jgi:hypothetical protein
MTATHAHRMWVFQYAAYKLTDEAITRCNRVVEGEFTRHPSRTREITCSACRREIGAPKRRKKAHV